jgi:hypothetical protein
MPACGDRAIDDLHRLDQDRDRQNENLQPMR